jgi:hypothetical protein
MWDFAPPKRFTLLVCLLHQATVATRDEVVQMVLKRMSKLHERAKEELVLIREREREITEHLIAVFSDVLHTSTQIEDNAKMGQSDPRSLHTRRGGCSSSRSMRYPLFS